MISDHSGKTVKLDDLYQSMGREGKVIGQEGLSAETDGSSHLNPVGNFAVDFGPNACCFFGDVCRDRNNLNEWRVQQDFRVLGHQIETA